MKIKKEVNLEKLLQYGFQKREQEYFKREEAQLNACYVVIELKVNENTRAIELEQKISTDLEDTGQDIVNDQYQPLISALAKLVKDNLIELN